MKLVAGQVYDFVAKFPPFRQSSLIITKVTKLSKFVNFVGAYTCPKCREYYLLGYKCHICGFDATDSETI